jgi:hypothetical protein
MCKHSAIHQEKREMEQGVVLLKKEKRKRVKNYSNIVIPSSLQKAKLG